MNANTSDNSSFPLFGGEMGHLIRTKNWGETLIGPPEQWSLVLRTTLGILLNSKFPMFLFWGKDLVCFYNDAYRPSLGNEGKHPDALGKKGEEVWTEIWDIIKPLIDQVLAGGEASWSEDQLIPIYRNGKIEDVYWTFSYSAVRGEDSNPEGVFVTCVETTEKVFGAKKLQESEERFRTMAEATDVLIAVGDETSKATYFNKAWSTLSGRTMNELVEFGWADLIHPDDKADYIKNYLDAFEQTTFFTGEFRFLNKNGEYRWLLAKGSPRFHPDDTFAGFISSGIDITEQKQMHEKELQYNENLRNFFSQAPAAIALLELPDQRYILANELYQNLFSRNRENLIGRTIKEVFPEVEGQGIFEIFDNIYKTGEPFLAHEFRASLDAKGTSKTGYYDFIAKPIKNSDGHVTNIMIHASEVTEQVLARQKVEESETKLKSLISAAPIGIGLFIGRDLIIDTANNEFITTVGKGANIIGKPLATVMPELTGEKQPFLQILDDVFTSGKMYQSFGEEVSIERNGVMEKGFFDINYVPLIDAEGKVYGIMDIATNVTEQVQSRKSIQESEERFRNLADGSPMFVFIIEPDSAAPVSYWNRTWLDYTGQTFEEAKGRAWNGIVHPDDVPVVMQHFTPAFQNQQSYIIPAVRVLKHDGEYRWHSFKANPRVLPNGQFNGYVGVGFDIHEQKLAEEKLKDSEAFSRSVLENSPDCVKIIDSEGLIQYMNTNGRCIMEIDDFGKFKNKPWAELWGEENYQVAVDAIATAKKGKTAQFQALCFTAKGTPKWWDVMVSPVHDTGSDVVTNIISVSRDITEQREAQSLLEYRKALLEAHNESSVDGILLVDAKGKMISYNHRFTEIWNFEQHIMDAKNDEAALEDAMKQVVDPDTFIEKVRWLYNHPTERSLDIVELKNGKVLERHGYPVVADDGSYYAWSWTFRDITEQRSFQSLLEYRKALLEAHNESSADGILLVDDKGKIISFNKRYVEIWNLPPQIAQGIDQEQIIRFTLSQVVSPEHLIAKNKYIHENPLSADTILLELINGKIVERHNYPVIGEDGTFYGVSLTYRDITEIKKAELVLRKSEENFRQLAELLPDKINTADAVGNVTYYSRNWESYTGVTLENLYSQGWMILMHPDDLPAIKTRWNRSVETGDYFEMEFRIKDRFGTYKWHLSRASAVKDEQGKIIKWIGSMAEIQQQKEQRQKLEHAVQERTSELQLAKLQVERKNDELLKMNKELESFTYVSSHDLQEPLRKIQTFAGRILDREGSNFTEVGKDYFRRMQSAAGRMQKLIEDLLSFSRLNTADRKFELTDLGIIAENVKQDFKEIIDEKQAIVEVSKMCEAPIIPFQFHQLLHNLIGNSLKFAKPGIPPHIIVTSVTDKGEKLNTEKLLHNVNYCHIKISDNGIGFDPAYKERIFEVFQRLHGKEEFPGTGIGLAIVKKVVENHQGIIIASAEKNVGARFDIYIPV